MICTRESKEYKYKYTAFVVLFQINFAARLNQGLLKLLWTVYSDFRGKITIMLKIKKKTLLTRISQ